MSRWSTAKRKKSGSGTPLATPGRAPGRGQAPARGQAPVEEPKGGPGAASGAPVDGLQDGWERFWFAPQRTASLRLVRLGLGVVAACYFASHWADIDHWFASDGVLSTERLGQLVGSTGAPRWNLTPLYWIESTAGLRAVLAVGFAASLAMAAGIGGRWIVALVWLLLLSVVARCWVITGIAEIPIILGTGILIVAAGARREGASVGRAWTTGLARRLLEVHVAALVAMAALAQLAAEIWWDGTGVVHLVLRPDGPAWDLSPLVSGPLLAGALTHAIVWLPIAAVPMLWTGRTRRGAAIAIIVHAVAIGVLSGQMLYGATVAVMASVFLVRRD